eukprot:7294314-Prymnesium_polylepis.1
MPRRTWPTERRPRGLTVVEQRKLKPFETAYYQIVERNLAMVHPRVTAWRGWSCSSTCVRREALVAFPYVARSTAPSLAASAVRVKFV